MEKKPQTQTAAAMLMKDSQGQKLNRLLLCLVMLIAVVLITAFVPKADAATLDDGGFCVSAVGFDGEFEGTHGPTMCHEIGEPEEPEVPQIPVGKLTAAVSAQGTHYSNITWQSMPPREAYTGKIMDSTGKVVKTIAAPNGASITLDYYWVLTNKFPAGTYSFTMTHDASGKVSDPVTLRVSALGVLATT